MKKHYLFRVLRLIIIFLMVGFIHVSASSYSQTITLHVKQLPLATVLESIRKQTGYAVYANVLHLKETKPVSITAKNMPLQDFLDKILVDQPLQASVEDKTIVLFKRTAEKNTNVNINPTNAEAKPIQQLRVSGKVVSVDDGKAISGVSVSVKGTTKGVSTDNEGNYSLNNVNRDDILLFSSVGFNTLELAVNGRVKIDIKMSPQLQTLDQVMVVAYGTAKKSTFTGSASVINEDVFKNKPTTEVTQALTGTTPGLQVGTSNGQPGSEPTIRIRGLGSFNASSSPLIILDGIPYDNAITSINPNDIESVTVLKDASSAALYGARGANGVLLINTKKGKAGKPTIVTKYNFGLTSRQSADYERLNDKDYMELYWEAQRNTYVLNGSTVQNANAQAGPALLAGISYNPYLMSATELFDNNGKLNPNAVNHWADDTDWYGGITRTGRRHDTNISISGGNDKTDYYTSLGYMNEEGFIIGSKFDRLSAKANANSQITKWLKMGTNINVAHAKSNGEQTETSGSISNPFRATRYMGNIFPIHLHNPTTGEYIFDAQGNKIPDFGSGWTSADGTITIPGRDTFAGSNHPFEVNDTYRGLLRQTLNLKGYADVSLLDGLKFTANGGLGSNMYRSWAGGMVYPQKGNAGSSAQNTSNTTTWTFQQLLNYSKDFGKHHFDLLAGHESYQFQYWYLSTSMKTQTIVGDNFEYANFTEVNALPNSYTHNYRVEGYLSRLNYDFGEKYFASASYRRDGSSRFNKNVRWGNFWSLGAGWAVDKENFMDNVKFVNHLKLRASYGVVGNDDLSSYYPWRATYTPNDNGEAGYAQSSLGNKDLTWETSKSFDIAAEFGLFANRLNGSVEYFHRVSSDLLFSVPQPISSGIGSIDKNAGSMYNKGIELNLNGQILKSKDWNININMNSTWIKNKITSLPVDPYTSSIYKIEKGHSRYDFWLRDWYGVNPDNGFNLFRADLDKFTFTPSELKEIDGVKYTENVEKSLYGYAGSAMPKLTGGFGADVGWKNFNLRVNFYYQLGSKFYDAGYKSFMTGSLSYASQHKDMLKRWRKPGDITDVAIAAMTVSGTNSVNIDASNSTRWLVSSNMLELTNLNLSYSLPKKFLKSKNISDALIYFSANNAWLLASRKGVYPRRNFQSGYISNDDVYPPSTIASFGLSLTF
ncbi:TonB-dependent receptor [Pedobacter sp. UBA4863]|uniref:TonB-dependent receptor n=1 Tax=Pedobacter sp. UBA4863 TaxID=1947060 RepID=UPI0025D695B4|nr:TonB-dependent receptor [Pedobacter sp. UBA4863]